MQLGHNALIRMPSGSNGFANDLTVPTTPCLEVPYMGPIGKGYSPAFEAVQTINPLSSEVFFRI